MMKPTITFLLTPLAVLLLINSAAAAEPDLRWQVGTARVDVTPTEPVRMAGYGSRNRPSEGIDAPLYVRCVAVKRHDEDGPAALLLSIDTIGLPGSMSRELAEQVQQKHGTPRDRIVFCCTHTHTGPDLVSELSNIFSTELTEQEIAAGRRYRRQLRQGILDAVDQALETLVPANVAYAVGETDFAANRRVLTNGRWTGFGVQSDGPVDHSVPVLRIHDAEGSLAAVVFNYACHCTTLGGDHFRINGDWAGYACQTLEAQHAGCVALCTIGCGADANPEPRGNLDAAKLHGRTLAAEVERVLAGEMRNVDQPLQTRFDYAGLSFELPTAEELEHRREHGDSPQTRRHAEQMLEVYREEGRLPATYPVPIQAWKFGDQLTMVFLGGEVVVDYALRLKRQLDNPDLWITAYANDVLGYIASERMRAEGGYEYDRSGIYYGLPGPWAAGTEDLFIRRITEVLESKGRSKPLDPDQAMNSFELGPDARIELVAAEPLVQDPINIAFGADGRLWVVEMSDYPLGDEGGRIKVLSDSDGDGRYDTADLFLSGLPFPTGVQPWGDGVLIASAPQILMARDTTGDGKADQTKPLYDGFRLANPQHRISGFSYGLDHSLHCSSGDNLAEITSLVTNATVNASGHDVKIWPDDGRLAVVSGRTQYIRSRNDWGQWFGNDNSRPMYHFPIDSEYLKRNPHVSFTSGSEMLFDPPVAPPVFPRTPSTERFNDLFAANRFTSACSAIVFRGTAFHPTEHDVAFICEPVHNLVHRAILQPAGASFRAVRSESEQASEFLASSDPWFRPTRAITGPDGSLWIVDMYRETIEHPEWIPQAWQQQLDLRAGEDRGRIYRITAEDHTADDRWKSMDGSTASELVNLLRSPNGMLRDMAQRLIVHRDDPDITELLERLAAEKSCPHGQVHALSILAVKEQLEDSLLLAALDCDHPGVLQVVLRLSESRIKNSPALLDRLAQLARHSDPGVRLQTALACGQTDDPSAGEVLAEIAVDPHNDRWIAQAVSSSAVPHATTIAERMIDQIESIMADRNEVMSRLLTDVVVTAKATGSDLNDSIVAALTRDDSDFASRLEIAAFFSDLLETDGKDNPPLQETLRALYERAVPLIRSGTAPVQQRAQALTLLGLGFATDSEERGLLLPLLGPATEPDLQIRAIDHLVSSTDTSAADEILQRWPSMSQAVRNHLIGQILQRRDWTERLLDALEQNQIRPTDLTAAARSQLLQTGSRSMRVRASRLLNQSGPTEKRQLVRSYLEKFSSPSRRDLDHGAALFKKHCAVCHTPDAEGRAAGASLDNLSNRSDDVLAEAILDPNRAVDPKYQNYIVQTVDDRILAGAIEQEAGSSLTLAHADGKRTTLNRKEIESMKNSGISLMPEGFEQNLTPQDLQDIIYYLQQFPQLSQVSRD